MTLTPLALATRAEAQVVEPRRGYIAARTALHYEKLPGKKVRCGLCPHGCVVKSGARGRCRVRVNRGGEYYTLVHSNPCAVHIDPIEKKPLFHFHPGTTALSLATAGCNFTCKNCQNHDISQAKPEDTLNYHLEPQDVVGLAERYHTPTIAYTYTEPSVFFEYMLDIARLARAQGIWSIYHSNGYLNREPLSELAPLLDGANIDLKGYDRAFYRDIAGGELQPVLDTLVALKKAGVWLEITNLVIPTKNDNADKIRQLCGWIVDHLGADIPVHFSRFYPMYRLTELYPTPTQTLQAAVEIARDMGLRYPYIGNIPGIAEESTQCPGCGKTVIKRIGYDVLEFHVTNGKCAYCRTPIAGRW